MKALIISFEENECDFIESILKLINAETKVIKYINRNEKMLSFEGLRIDIKRREVIRNNEIIELTYTEFEILVLLAQNIGMVFSKEQIYDTVWKEPYFGDYNIVMSHIYNLREKIEDNPSKPIYIHVETIVTLHRTDS